MKILVVEDDAVSAKIVCKRAETLGHDTETLRDGQEAWLRLSGPSDIDVVISGWYQPGLNGRELCQRVRERAGRYLPFIFLTAAGDRETQLEGMRAGADDYLVKPLDLHDLHLRLIAAERLTRLHRRSEAQADELRRLNSKLYDQSRHDIVTGVPNRLRLEEDASQLYEQAVRLGLGYSIAMVDVDHFKRFNDTWGHQRGDDVLRAIAHAMARSARAGDQVYRYGGEEFVVVLQTDDPVVASQITERVRKAVEELGIAHPSPEGRVTVSLGVATMNAHALRPVQDVLARADAAMYRAKREGRNRVAAWDPSVDQLFEPPPPPQPAEEKRS